MRAHLRLLVAAAHVRNAYDYWRRPAKDAGGRHPQPGRQDADPAVELFYS